MYKRLNDKRRLGERDTSKVSYHEWPHELRLAICSEAPAPISDFGGEADVEARRRANETSDDSLVRDWTKKSGLDNQAVAQYRRERAILTPPTWPEHEARAYAELQAEQQRAMRDLVTGEYWRLVAVRDAPHQEPVRTRQISTPV